MKPGVKQDGNPQSQADPHDFLGREFLIWLWWQAETKGGVFAVGPAVKGERVGIALDRLLEFHDEATGVRVVVRGDAPTRAPEAREALSRGLHLLRAGLIVTVGEENVSLVLDGESLDLRSVKAERPEGESREEKDASALASLFGLVESLNLVYRAFLVERVADRFATEIAPRLQEWAAGATRGSRRSSAATEGSVESAAI